MPILNDILNQGQWMYEICYEDNYSLGHALLLQGYLSSCFYSSFNLIDIKEVKEENGKKS